MKGCRIVDLSLPIINGGGFGKPARIRYPDHLSRGKTLADQVGIDPADIKCDWNKKGVDKIMGSVQIVKQYDHYMT